MIKKSRKKSNEDDNDIEFDGFILLGLGVLILSILVIRKNPITMIKVIKEVPKLVAQINPPVL